VEDPLEGVVAAGLLTTRPVGGRPLLVVVGGCTAVEAAALGEAPHRSWAPATRAWLTTRQDSAPQLPKKTQIKYSIKLENIFICFWHEPCVCHLYCPPIRERYHEEYRLFIGNMPIHFTKAERYWGCTTV